MSSRIDFMEPKSCPCNDSEIEVEDGVVCEICGLELEEFDQVTGTGFTGTTTGHALRMWTRKWR